MQARTAACARARARACSSAVEEHPANPGQQLIAAIRIEAADPP
jgi:hypothetical protein